VIATPEDPAAPIDPGAFPALERLARRGRRVPFVAQLEAADCGAACLAMTLRYWGRAARLDEVRARIGSGRDGIDALSLLRGAEELGLRGRGLRVEVEDLRYLPPATILHWEFNHFVVFERVTRRGVIILDPGHGRRTVPIARFRKSFTGVALVLEPAASLGAGGEKGARPLRRYARLILEQRGLLGRVLTVSILLRVLALALPILLGLVVDRVVPRADRDLLMILGVGLGAMLAVQLLSSLVRSHLLLELRTQLDTRMTLGFLDHLVALPYAFFQHRSTGDLMMRVAGNTAIRERLTTAVLSSILDGALVALYLVFAFLLAPPLALIALVIGALQVAVYLIARRRVRDLMSQDLESQARAQSYLVQMLAGIESLKVAGAERRAVQHWSNLFVDELNVSLARGRLDAAVGALRGMLSAGAPLVLLGYGAVLVLDGQLSLGTMLAVNGMAIGFLQPLDVLVEAGLSVASLGSYVDRLDDVLATAPEQSGGTPPQRLRGQIEVRDLSFRYGPNAPLVVRDVSLSIPAGRMVAVVGASGSGKSTFAKLLLGLYQPTEGRILYDGQNLAELELRALRRQLGIVPQQPYLFGGSVRDNIALGDPTVAHDRVVAAARLACIHDDIRAMGMGYETPMADGGVTLSGGQRQRLALARALLHEPAILLLDEATSSLDAKTERSVIDNLAELACTRIVIAHRLSTIVSADVIVVMQDGAIVETGTHDDLLARGGVYHGLVASQPARERAR
jgi:ATP-binding cassette subfamily B protein